MSHYLETARHNGGVQGYVWSLSPANWAGEDARGAFNEAVWGGPHDELPLERSDVLRDPYAAWVLRGVGYAALDVDAVGAEGLRWARSDADVAFSTKVSFVWLVDLKGRRCEDGHEHGPGAHLGMDEEGVLPLAPQSALDGRGLHGDRGRELRLVTRLPQI